jgi:hypothetical protein
MTESLDDVRRRGPLMPLAMVGAFAIGAGIAAWFIFGEDFKQWARQENLAWEVRAGEHLVLVEQHRLRRTSTGMPEVFTTTTTEWTIVPDADVRIPGQETVWTQILNTASVEHRVGGAISYEHTWAPREPDEEPSEDTEEIPADVSWAPLLGEIQGLSLQVRIGESATTAVSVTPSEILEQLETRRTGKPLEKRKPLTEAALQDLHAELDRFLHRDVVGLAAILEDELYRPGQRWSRVLEVGMDPWGRQGAKFDLRLDSYDGDIAVVPALITRPPGEALLAAADDGLSGLRGNGEYRLDCIAHRPVSGRMTLEGSGKIDRKFATIEVSHAWALCPRTRRLPSRPTPPPLQ